VTDPVEPLKTLTGALDRQDAPGPRATQRPERRVLYQCGNDARRTPRRSAIQRDSLRQQHKFAAFPLSSDPCHQGQFSSRAIKEIALGENLGRATHLIDRPYLTQWATYLKVADLLEEALHPG
jgi:hypothetical protein